MSPIQRSLLLFPVQWYLHNTQGGIAYARRVAIFQPREHLETTLYVLTRILYRPRAPARRTAPANFVSIKSGISDRDGIRLNTAGSNPGITVFQEAILDRPVPGWVFSFSFTYRRDVATNLSRIRHMETKLDILFEHTCSFW